MIKTSDFKQDIKQPNYQPNSDETIKIDYIKKRFYEMQQARTVIDKDWETYQTMIDAIYTPYPDERSSSVVPLASSLIELYVAETSKIDTKYTFRSENSENTTQARALEYVWKYDWRKKARKKEFLDNEYITA